MKALTFKGKTLAELTPEERKESEAYAFKILNEPLRSVPSHHRIAWQWIRDLINKQ